MSGYLNRVTLIGNLGADPEVRPTQSGQKIVTMSIATTERWKDQRSGEYASAPSGIASSSSTMALPTSPRSIS